MSDLNCPPFAVGTQTSSATNAPHVGNVYRITNAAGLDILYRMCKASAALLVNGVVTTGYTAGVPTFSVGHTTIAADPNVVGVVPSAYTSGVTSGNYFLAQISGPCTFIAGDTTITMLSGTEYRMVTFTTASGQVRVVSTFTTASTSDLAGVFGFATNSAVATAIGQTITGVLTGLINRF